LAEWSAVIVGSAPSRSGGGTTLLTALLSMTTALTVASVYVLCRARQMASATHQSAPRANGDTLDDLAVLVRELARSRCLAAAIEASAAHVRRHRWGVGLAVTVAASAWHVLQ